MFAKEEIEWEKFYILDIEENPGKSRPRKFFSGAPNVGPGLTNWEKLFIALVEAARETRASPKTPIDVS